MIMECTDCKYCLDFVDGYRVFCMHPEMPTNAVCNFYPVSDGDAEMCFYFRDDESIRIHSLRRLDAAEEFSVQMCGEVTYLGIRAWFIDQYPDRYNQFVKECKKEEE